MLFNRYAETRVLCNLLDGETKISLERCLEGMTKATKRINSDDLPWHLIVTRMSLALVLHVLKVELEEQQS